jgi:hypothetical protein
MIPAADWSGFHDRWIIAFEFVLDTPSIGPRVIRRNVDRGASQIVVVQRGILAGHNERVGYLDDLRRRPADATDRAKLCFSG